MKITEQRIKEIIRDSGDYKYDPPNATVAAGIIYLEIQKELKDCEVTIVIYE